MGIASSVSMAFSEEEPSANANETKEEEKEEEGECILCKYIKRGECKESFIALEKCVDESKEDPTRCMEVWKIFMTCMLDNPVYYAPFITSEAHAVARESSEQLQGEKEAVLAGDAAAVAKLKTEEQPVPLPAEVAANAKAFQELQADKEEGHQTSDHQPQR